MNSNYDFVATSIKMFCGTVFLNILANVTLSQVANMATIFAGVTTASYTIYKWIKRK